MEKKLSHGMKKSLLILLALTFFISHNAQADSHWLKSFYEAYMTNVMEGADNAGLCRLYMQEGLVKKLQRVTTATGADAVLRSQDVNVDALRTLSVIDIGNDWYMVEYRWDEDRPETEIRIPVKSMAEEDRCVIAYIVPVWNGEQYGDGLIFKENNCIDVVDNTSGMAFVETFYRKYLSVYYSMPGNLETELSGLRSEYMTENALAQYRETAAVNAWDGYPGYDMLVCNYDFDYSWDSSVRITRENDNTYKFTYSIGVANKSIVLSVEKVNGRFKINSLYSMNLEDAKSVVRDSFNNIGDSAGCNIIRS